MSTELLAQLNALINQFEAELWRETRRLMIEVGYGPLRIGPDESWCRRCGETMNTTGYCHRCGSQRGLAAVQVLRTDEYYIAR